MCPVKHTLPIRLSPCTGSVWDSQFKSDATSSSLPYTASTNVSLAAEKKCDMAALFEPVAPSIEEGASFTYWVRILQSDNLETFKAFSRVSRIDREAEQG